MCTAYTGGLRLIMVDGVLQDDIEHIHETNYDHLLRLKEINI